jgi:subtilisin family serine protease
VAEAFVAVGALGRGEGQNSFVVAPFSNTGPRLVAPGVDILSARLGGGLAVKSGTSMATPHVAGVAALWAQRIRSRGQEIQGAEVIKLMEQHALPLNTLFDELDVGLGLVQAP